MKVCTALAGAVLALLSSTNAAAGGTEGGTSVTGLALYLEGAHAGQPLIATRAGGLTMRGAAAACVNCHRRSGLGGSEGRSYIPPIDAASLFTARAVGTGASATGNGRPAYTDETLARAIRGGLDPTGRALEYLMPRYALDDAQMRSLIAYLHELSAERAEGASGETIDFATVIARGVPPERSHAMVDILQACVDEHNAGPAPQRGRKLLGPDMMVGQQQKWRLHVWNLRDDPQTWKQRLADYASRTPVFALVGGIGAGNWAPVHEFCEANRIPCVFPRVEAPVEDKAGFYALYLNRGVLLEAALIARNVAGEGRPAKRVLQVLRADDDAARAGADALRRDFSARGIEVEERKIGATAALDAHSLAAARADALVLWLRGDDLQRLQSMEADGPPVYLSAMLADPEQRPLAHAWKTRALIAYPYELPENRAPSTARFHGWLKARGLALVDEPVQSDAYTACTTLRMGMNELREHVNRDFLVERLEVITERAGYTGLYPRLSLGIGQRFASKSGYLVRYDQSDARHIVAASERTAP